MDLNVIANINSLSYGVVSFYLLKAFDKLGINVSLFCPRNCDIAAYSDQDVSFLRKFVDNSWKFNPKVPTLKIYHQNNLADSIGSGTRFAYSFFELEHLNEIERHHINSLDGFFVGSHWAKEVCEKNDIKVPVYVAPPCLDENLINFKKYDKNYHNDTIVFSTVGKWEQRKSHLEMIKAFEKCFDIFDNVELKMYCGNTPDDPRNYQEWLKKIEQSPLRHMIKIMPFVEKHSEMVRAISEADVYLSFSKAEGFDLPLFEAMRQGVLCIATDCTAHKEYILDSNCLKIDPIGTELAHDGKWFNKKDDKLTWSSFNFEDFCKKIKNSVEILQQGQYNTITRNAIATTTNFSWEKTAKKMLEKMI
jgi:glycosyltransferase involved in cell wall biosynthesis